MNGEELRCCPVGTFYRINYSMVMLIKVYISSKSPDSKLGAVLEHKFLRLGHYLEAIISKLIDAAGIFECRAPLAFLGMLRWFQEWYERQINDPVFSNLAKVPPMPEVCSIPPTSKRAQNADFLIHTGPFAELNYEEESAFQPLENTIFLEQNHDLALGFLVDSANEIDPFPLDPELSHGWDLENNQNIDNLVSTNFDWSRFVAGNAHS